MPEAVISSDHPALPGHFPGQPVVPGVVILSEVFATVHRAHPEVVIEGIRQAKFLAQLGPDQAFDIELDESTGDSLKFVCRSGATILVQGRLRIASTGASE